MKNISYRILPILLFSLFIASLVPTSAASAAPAAADFYKDKVVTIVVTGPPGSVNDIYGRLAAIYLSEITGARVGV
jgi:tripartite-type tricarboxylate transporter receptor subunit TctC